MCLSFLEGMLFVGVVERSIEWCPTSVALGFGEGEVSERAKRGMVVRVEELCRRNRWDCWRVGSIVTEGFAWI